MAAVLGPSEEDNKTESISKISMETVVKEMHDEFKKRRKVLLSGLPSNLTTVEDIRALLSPSCNNFSLISNITDNTSVRLLFHSAHTANEALQELDGQVVQGHTLSAKYGHPDSLLFVGNFAKFYDRNKLHELFLPFGTIVRCLVVYSTSTGLSKCYGFVEFSTREEAMLAKQQMATKSLNGRSLRVDFADNGMQSCDDLQSCTLFVDRLPKSLKKEERLKELFGKYGTVNFCQIALTTSGTSRCFAFIDYSTSESAEKGHLNCNGIEIDGQEIRVSYGMPCRPGACILQSKNNNQLVFGSGKGVVSTTTKRSVTPILCFQQEGFIANNSSTLKLLHSFGGQQHLLVPVTEICTTPLLSPPPPLTSLPPPSKHNKENIKPKSSLKRTITDRSPSPLTDDDDTPHSVYDKPFISQHDQGIPYTHPLKRIKTATTIV